MSDLLDTITLYARIIKRAVYLLLQRSRKLELMYFTYKPDADTNDTVIIRYSFKNVLWYIFDGEKTLEGRQVAVRHRNMDKDIPLTVQGFMRKNRYIIKLQPNAVFIVEMPKQRAPIGINTIKNVER